MKKAGLVAAATGVFFAVLIVAALLYLNSSAFRRLVVERVDTAIAGHLRVENHALDPVAGTLTLSGVTLSDPGGRAVADIGRLHLSLYLPALAWRTVDFSAIVIEHADVNLAADAENRTNIAEALSPTTARQKSPRPTGGDWNIKIGGFRLRDGRMAYRQPEKGVIYSVSDLEASGRGDLRRRRVQMDLRAGDLHFQVPGRDDRLHDVSLELEYDEAAKDPVMVAVRMAEASVKARGRLAGVDGQPEVALTADLDLPLARIRPWLPQAIDASGRLAGNVRLEGSLTDPSLAARLSFSGGRVQGIPIREAELDARLAQRQVTIELLAVRSPVGDLDMSGAVDLRPVYPRAFDSREGGWNDLTYALDLKAHRIRPREVPQLASVWGGAWGADIHVNGRGIAPGDVEGSGDLALRAEGIRLTQGARPAAAALTAQAAWSDQTLTINKVRADLDRHRLIGKGSLQWADRRFGVEATVQSPQLSELGAAVGIALPRGKATLKLNGRGAIQKPVVRAVLLAQDLVQPPWTIGRALVETELASGGRVTVSRLVLENNGSYVEGRGRVDLLTPEGALVNDPGLDFNFDFDPVELSDFYSEPIEGDLLIKGRLRVGGSLSRPSADLQLNSGRVRWNEVAADIEGKAALKDGRMTVPRLDLSRGRSSLTLQGALDWTQGRPGGWTTDPHVRIDMTSSGFYLQDWLVETGGAFDIKAALEGRMSNLKGNFDLEGSDVDTGVQRLSALRLEGRLADDTIFVDHLAAVVTPGQTIAGNGWVAFDRRFQARIGGDGIALGRIDALRSSSGIDGRVNLSVQADGTVDRPRIRGRLQVRGPKIGDRQWDDFTLRFDHRDRLSTVAADLNFDLTAGYEWDSGDFEVRADFDQTELGPWLALFTDDRWSGRLSGSMHATGNRRRPENIDARILLTRTHLAYKRIQLIHFDRLEARLDKGTVVLPPTRAALMQEGAMTLRAGGRIQDGLTIRMQGDLPIAVLTPFSEDLLEPAGRIHLRAQGQGPWNRMQWRGEATLADVGFLWADWDQAVHGVNGTVRIEPERIVVDRLSGMLDNGRFDVNGDLQLANWRPIGGEMHLTAPALPVHRPGTMDLLLGADLVLKGRSRQSVLEGRITLLEGAYYKNVNLNIVSSLTRVRRAQPVPRTGAPPEWATAVALDVAVDYRYPLLVDNNVARMQVAPDFRIEGTAAEPRVTGRARVTEGDVFFRSNTFAVRRGVVDFVNPYRIEPTIDIVAAARIRRWEVTLTATGTPDNLAVELSSDPPESDSNILSLILTGRTSAELAEGEGGGTPEQMLASLAGSAWGETIKKRTGVDILEVETGADAESQDADRIQVTVGKHLSPRLTVRYSVETGDETVQRATSEYRLLEHILASGFQDTGGNYGGELLFRIEFR